MPSWSKHPGKWSDIISYQEMPAPKVAYRFIHRDFHPNNVLFENGNITGVVDWINACIGPLGVDVGHCRWNLAMMYGVKAADDFLEVYKANYPAFIYHEYWDVVTLLDVLSDPIDVYEGWSLFGLTEVNKAVMIERMDCYMESI